MAKENKKEQKVEKPSVPSTEFEFDGAKYKFKVAHFRVIGMNDNNPILAKDALKDSELLEGLIKIKAGVIEKVGEVAPEGKEDK